MNNVPEIFTAAIRRLYDDKQPIQVECDKQTMFCVISTIQLACRHPNFNGQTRRVVEDWARQIGDAMTANDADLRMLYEMGWHKQFDEVKK